MQAKNDVFKQNFIVDEAANDDLLIDEIIIRKHIDNEYNHSPSNMKLTTETIFHNTDNKSIIGLTPLILISNNNNNDNHITLSSPQQLQSILSTTDTQSIIKLSCSSIEENCLHPLLASCLIIFSCPKCVSEM